MKKLIKVLVPVLLAALTVGSLAWYLLVYDREFTRDMLLKQARYQDSFGNTRVSAWFYNLAYLSSDQDQSVAIELARQYISDDNYTKAEVTLTNAIRNDPSVDLYASLCRVYIEQDKLLDAVALLASIQNSDLKAQIDAARPEAPAANYSSGFYNQYITIAFDNTDNMIYCSTDGNYPSVNDPVYTEPFTLPLGETKVIAVSQNKSGLVSTLMVNTYTVGGVIEPAVFADAEFENAVRSALGVNDSKILYTNDLWQLTSFEVPAEVTALDDLNKLTYLENLTISNHNIDSLEPVASLVKLRSLDLSGSKFNADELSIISSLPELNTLKMNNCGISTIAALQNAPKLNYLDISNNTLRNLDSLSTIPTLSELYLAHNALSNLEALSVLTNLQKIDVSYNSLKSIAALGTCVKLTFINAGNNAITDARGTESLPLLEELYLLNNKMSDVTTLTGCLSLTHLSLSNNNISDISVLSSMNTLIYLDFSHNSISEIPSFSKKSKLQIIDGSYNEIKKINTLKKLEEIAYVYMDYNDIESIDALAECYHLVQVNVFGNPISDVTKLTNHGIIVNWDPTNEAD